MTLPPSDLTLGGIAHIAQACARHNGHSDLVRQSIAGQVGDEGYRAIQLTHGLVGLHVMHVRLDDR